MLGLSQAFPRWIPTQRLESADLEVSGVVDQVIGAYLMIRRPLYEALGGFDERFFGLPRGRRSGVPRDAGGPPLLLPARRSRPARWAGELGAGRGKRLFYLLRGRTQFARKHWPPWQAAVLGSMTLCRRAPRSLADRGWHGQRDEIDGIREATAAYARYFLGGGKQGHREGL